MLEPSCGMVEGGLPPLARGIGAGECAGDGTAMGTAGVCCSVLFETLGELSWNEPNWTMAALDPPTGPPLVPAKPPGPVVTELLRL